jgi:phage tail-like protein
MEQHFANPSTSHRFGVLFWADRMPVPDLLDMRFQRVQGLSRELGVTAHTEGGENLRNQYFIEKLNHGSLVLERGVTTLTPLTAMFNFQLTTGKPWYLNAVISVFDPGPLPLTNWLVIKANPVRWQTSDLDANSNRVLINTLELRYQEMIPFGVRI